MYSAMERRMSDGNKIFKQVLNLLCLAESTRNPSTLDSTQGLLDLDGRNSQKYLHQTQANF